MKRKLLSALLLLPGFLLGLMPGKTTAQSPCKGVLVVNEISNGANGAKEFAEFVAASCGSCAETTVDISRWIIDDNNGIFTTNPAVAGSNLGISAGHLRLTNDSLWKNFPRGFILVLFNVTDFDSTNADLTSAAATTGYFQNGSAIYVAVGTSTLVEHKTNLPIVGGASTSPNYCNASLYTVDTFAWNTIGLRNSRLGDGIQVRCPGCTTGLGEPTFYHGFSYGDTTSHVVNSDTSFLDGAHFEFDPSDTIGGTGRAFQFSIGTNPEADAGWTAVNAADASPGISNSDDNQLFIDLISEGSLTFNCCPEPVIDTTPVKGIVMVTEVSNGPSGSCEYVELLVSACSGSDADSVDIRGWIIDDNSGNFNSTRTCATGVGISSGHVKLAHTDVWKKVPVGAVIVLFNGGDNCYNFVDDTADNNHDSIYFVKVGTNVNVVRTTTKPSTSSCTYCTGSYIVGTNANAWPTIGLGNDKDAVQVRCPGCIDENPGEPAFYHGFGYGSGFSGFAAGVSDLGGAYLSGTGSGKIYEFFQGNAVGLNANWRSATASAAGTPPATAGQVFASFRDSVRAGLYNFPCCGTSPGMSAAPASPFDAIKSYTNNTRNEQVSQGSAYLYPNPAGDVLNININRAGGFSVRIIDLLGKEYYNQSYPATQGTTSSIRLNLNEIPKGVYIYTISATSGNEETLSGRLMISK